MGTLNVLLLGGAEEKLLSRGAQEALEIFSRLEQSLSKFLPGSDVSLVNELAASRPVRVGQDLLRLLKLAREAWELTGGAFDPTVGTLLKAWGLVTMEGRIPSDAEIERLLELRGMSHVIVDDENGTVELARGGVSIDLGAIGKGYAVDAMAKHLRCRGIPVGAISSGRSSVLTWGTPPGEERWSFEVARPDDPSEALRALEAEPGSLSSSGAYERRFIRAGKEYGHVIDPRTGHPSARVRGVTVWSETALLGDVLSTALFVLGPRAAAPGSVLEKLAQAWRWMGPGGEARVSALFVEDEPGSWGGLKAQAHFVGKPGFHL
jgi:thiamine biosynthesis lipoprotein